MKKELIDYIIEKFDGEINTMFAPVQSMEGDTATIRMYFFDEWNFEYVQEVFFVVLD